MAIFWKPSHEELSDEYMERLETASFHGIRDRALVSSLMYCVLFLVILFATPIRKHHAEGVYAFGTLLLVVTLLRIFLLTSWSYFVPVRRRLWEKLFAAGFYIAALCWGLFACYSIAFYELGWTTFFIILVTLGISAAKVSLLAPRFNLLKWYLLLIFVPSVLANSFLVGGLRGTALSLFFGGFFVLLLAQGRLQFLDHWKTVRSSARLQAMIDAMPGTLSWISSDLKYLGVNQRLAKLWSMRNEDFVGKKIGFADPHTEMAEFSRILFSGKSDRLASELHLSIAGSPRSYYAVGQKYNDDTEAVILGLDTTDYKESLLNLEFQKAQSRNSAKLATLGEITGNLANEIDSPLQSMSTQLQKLKSKQNIEEIGIIESELSRIRSLSSLLHRFSSSGPDEKTLLVKVETLFSEALALCSERFKRKGIQIRVGKYTPALSARCKETQILEVLLNLLNNSFDAVQDLDSPWVQLDAREISGHVEISVTDRGNGIPENIHDRLFEPLFTTKSASKSTGVGLSNSREIVATQGGTVYLDTDSKHTRFVVTLPKSAL